MCDDREAEVRLVLALCRPHPHLVSVMICPARPSDPPDPPQASRASRSLVPDDMRPSAACCLALLLFLFLLFATQAIAMRVEGLQC